MNRRRASLAAAILGLAVVALLITGSNEGDRPDCTVTFLGITNTPAARFAQFAISNSGSCAIEVGHYGTYWLGERPEYPLLPPTVLINLLYESIPPRAQRVLTTAVPPRSSEAVAEAGWRLECVFRRAESGLHSRIRPTQTWLSQMWPAICAAPTERRLVLSTASDWIREGSNKAQNGRANGSEPVLSDTNSTSSAAGSRR